jgi:hypothetical protein
MANSSRIKLKISHPIRSKNTYVMICYANEFNAILATPSRSQTRTDMVKAFEIIYDRLTAAGPAPRLHILDSECPAIVKTFIQSRQSKYQLVPPHDHHRNAAERVIRTFKIISLPQYVASPRLPHASVGPAAATGRIDTKRYARATTQPTKCCLDHASQCLRLPSNTD